MTNENQETKLADFKEVIADIAYEVGQVGYKNENSRETINQIIAWAKEFSETHKDTDWSMTDYLETVYDFTDEKLKTVSLGHKKPGLLEFENEIFAQMRPNINQMVLPPSSGQHTGKDNTTSESKTEKDSLDEILADTDKCETFGDADEVCPKCGSPTIRYNVHKSLYHCDKCGQTWSDKQYVLVEYPQDTSFFEQEDIGYPSWESQDNGARYVPQYDYIRQFGKSPDPAHCYRPVCWPDSQRYFEEIRPDAHCELIQDEGALEIFGSSALWVPLYMLD